MQKQPPPPQRRYVVRAPRELAERWDAYVRDAQRRTGLTNIGGSLLQKAMRAELALWDKTRGKADGLDGDGRGAGGGEDGQSGSSSQYGESDGNKAGSHTRVRGSAGGSDGG